MDVCGRYIELDTGVDLNQLIREILCVIGPNWDDSNEGQGRGSGPTAV